MTRSLRIAAFSAFASIAALTPFLAIDGAQAKGGKDYYAQTYQFNRPMNGYEGFSGAYHCSYVKTPKTVCAAGKCKKVWELLQTCQ